MNIFWRGPSHRPLPPLWGQRWFACWFLPWSRPMRPIWTQAKVSEGFDFSNPPPPPYALNTELSISVTKLKRFFSHVLSVSTIIHTVYRLWITRLRTVHQFFIEQWQWSCMLSKWHIFIWHNFHPHFVASPCPNNVPVVNCLVQPCQFAKCPRLLPSRLPWRLLLFPVEFSNCPDQRARKKFHGEVLNKVIPFNQWQCETSSFIFFQQHYQCCSQGKTVRMSN